MLILSNDFWHESAYRFHFSVIEIIRFRFIGVWVEIFSGEFIKILAIVRMPVECWPTWLWLLLLLVHRFVCCLCFHLFFSIYSNCCFAKCFICGANKQLVITNLKKVKEMRENIGYVIHITSTKILGIWCKAFPKINTESRFIALSISLVLWKSTAR